MLVQNAYPPKQFDKRSPLLLMIPVFPMQGVLLDAPDPV